MALTEEQLEQLGERLVPLFQELERAVIADIARRLKKTERLTETAEIMAVTLRDKGFSPAAIYKRVMEAINADRRMQNEIAANTLEAKKVLEEQIKALRENARTASEELWDDAGNMAFSNDLSVWEGEATPVKGTAFELLVQTMSKRATEELLNLTKSTGFRMATGELVDARRAYIRQVNLAFTKVASGAYSYGQAVEEAVRELAKSGLRTVDFGKGVTRQMDTAVRTAVMTASSQLAGEITMQNVAETGVNYVEVSAHWGAREGEGHANHAGWQGKVYRVQGEDDQYENLEKATGYPSDPAGLCGYNCRHAFYPYWPGISEPTEWPPEPGPFEVDGKTYTYYQATQEQRRREREIRALKREKAAYEAIGLKDKVKETARKIRLRTADYKEFSQNVGIRAKTERLRVCERTELSVGMLRQTKNTGVFAMLPERMSKKHIREIAKEFEINLKGVRLVIDADEEKLKPTFFYAGRADPQEIGRIDFFPQAFSGKEELTRTLFHEKIHVDQFKEFGAEYVQNHRAYFEELAESAEEEFIERMKKEGRL